MDVDIAEDSAKEEGDSPKFPGPGSLALVPVDQPGGYPVVDPRANMVPGHVVDELISSHNVSMQLSRELIDEIRKGSESQVSAANARAETAQAEAKAAIAQLEQAHLDANFELRALHAEQARKAAEEELTQLRAHIASQASSSNVPPPPDRRQVQPVHKAKGPTAAKSSARAPRQSELDTVPLEPSVRSAASILNLGRCGSYCGLTR